MVAAVELQEGSAAAPQSESAGSALNTRGRDRVWCAARHARRQQDALIPLTMAELSHIVSAVPMANIFRKRQVAERSCRRRPCSRPGTDSESIAPGSEQGVDALWRDAHGLGARFCPNLEQKKRQDCKRERLSRTHREILATKIEIRPQIIAARVRSRWLGPRPRCSRPICAPCYRCDSATGQRRMDLRL